MDGNSKIIFVFLAQLFLIFLDNFNRLMLIIFLNKKYYFNIFLNKKYLKKQF